MTCLVLLVQKLVDHCNHLVIIIKTVVTKLLLQFGNQKMSEGAKFGECDDWGNGSVQSHNLSLCMLKPELCGVMHFHGEATLDSNFHNICS